MVSAMQNSFDAGRHRRDAGLQRRVADEREACERQPRHDCDRSPIVARGKGGSGDEGGSENKMAIQAVPNAVSVRTAAIVPGSAAAPPVVRHRRRVERE